MRQIFGFTSPKLCPWKPNKITKAIDQFYESLAVCSQSKNDMSKLTSLEIRLVNDYIPILFVLLNDGDGLLTIRKKLHTLFRNENKLLSFSEFINFFDEFSHQFFVFKAWPKLHVKIKDKNRLLIAVFKIKFLVFIDYRLLL